MTRCPSQDELRGLLSGTVSGVSTEAIARHVDSCSTCQTALEHLSDDPVFAAMLRNDATAAETPRQQFLDHLKSPSLAETTIRPLIPTIPGYEILDEVGHGGAGIVYRARQLSLNRIVAIKVLLGAGVFATERDRFRTEALAAAKLNHPGIVHVHEVGEWFPHPGAAPLPYVCLEFVAGGSLDRKIARTPQPPRAAAELVVQLATAVQAAHQAGIVHRDIKPANVLIDAGTGQPKITDFGLAKQLDLGAGHTATGAIVGTPSYMSPEQARGNAKDVDFRTDVYALGAVLYELLTGRPPFQGLTPINTVVQVAEDEPLKPRSLQPTVPRDLETVCLKCLEKQPVRRYQSAEALSQDLNRFLAGKPTAARPVGFVGRLAKVARRHPIPASLVAALALVIVGSILGLTHLYLQSEQARKDADEERNKAVGERNRADDSRDGMQAMHDFLITQILEAPQLTVAGRKVTVLEMLEAASPKVANLFSKQPQLAAAVHTSLGETFHQYGEYAKAAFHHGESLRLHREVHGPRNELSLRAQVAMCTSLDALGKSDEAVPLLEDAIAGFNAINMNSSDPALRARMDLSNIARDIKKFDEAERWLLELLALSREAHGDNYPLTMEAELELITVRGIVSGPESAIAPLRACVARNEKVFGKKSQPATSVKGRLAECLLAAKKYDDCAVVLEELLPEYRERVGAKHPIGFKMQAELADCWLMQKKLKQAEAAYREALAGFIETMPANVSLIPNAMTRLARCLIDLEKYEEAEKLLLDAREKFKTAVHNHPEWTAQNKTILEMLYKQWKK